MKKLCIYISILFSVLYSTPSVADDAAFKKIIKDYLSVNTIKASIVQYIYPGDGSTEVFSGNYFAASHGFIRIDYLKPESQVVAVNNSGLYWYYTGRKLLFYSEKNGSENGSIPVLMNAIPAEDLDQIEVADQGVKFYSLFRMAHVYSIKSKKNRTEMTLWIDPAIQIVKRKIIMDESGREMVKEEYTSHDFISGVNVPSRIVLSARTASGVIQTVTEYSNIVINSRIDKNIFEFKITPEMKVRRLNDRK